MTEFEEIEREEIRFGVNEFIEVALKRVVRKKSAGKPFISISRGWFDYDNVENGEDPERRYRKQFTIPKPLAERIADLIYEYSDYELDDEEDDEDAES